MKPRLVLFFCLLLLSSVSFASSEDTAPLMKTRVDFSDKASLQRGAKWYMNYCSGCHSLQYMRYTRMAKDIQIVDKHGNILTELLKTNLIFSDANPGDSILAAIPLKSAREWFGIEPPDLSLAVRVRGADWIYTYLMSFYFSPNRPWGSNNWLFQDVGMPNVLLPLQGVQMAVRVKHEIPYLGGTKTVEVIDHLELLKSGSMSQHEFAQTVHDIVNFLAYVSEPFKPARIRLGFWVIGFLLLLLFLAYLLKKEYWKDIH